MARINPFSGTDFVEQGAGRGSEAPVAPPAKPLPLPTPPPPQTAPASEKAAYWRAEVRRLTNEAPPGTQRFTEEATGKVTVLEGTSIDPQWKEALDNAQAQASYWEGRGYEEAVTYPRTRADKAADEAAAVERARLTSGATVTAAGLGAGATTFSAQEATRRQEAQQEWQTGETAGKQAFTAGESALGREAATGDIELTGRLAEERAGRQREFEGEQNALDRQIRNVQNQIAQGTLDLQKALGIMQKWLDAQQFGVPEGAEYVPGFGPGGAVQEASRLAGVGFAPQRATPVAFDPTAMVRQTMGR